jgi:hypothetical protein
MTMTIDRDEWAGFCIEMDDIREKRKKCQADLKNAEADLNELEAREEKAFEQMRSDVTQNDLDFNDKDYTIKWGNGKIHLGSKSFLLVKRIYGSEGVTFTDLECDVFKVEEREEAKFLKCTTFNTFLARLKKILIEHSFPYEIVREKIKTDEYDDYENESDNIESTTLFKLKLFDVHKTDKSVQKKSKKN